MVCLINRDPCSNKSGFKFKCSELRNKFKKNWKKWLLIALLIYPFLNWGNFFNTLNTIGNAIGSIVWALLWPLRWVIAILLLGLALLKKHKQIWRWFKDKFKGGWGRFTKVVLALATSIGVPASVIAVLKPKFLTDVIYFLQNALNASFWSFQKVLVGISTAVTSFTPNNANYESFGNVLSSLQKIGEYPKEYQVQYAPQIKKEVSKLLISVETKLKEVEQQLKDLSPEAYEAYKDLSKDINSIDKTNKVVEELRSVKCMVKMRKSALGAYHYVELTDEYIKDLPKRSCESAGAIVVDMEKVKGWYGYSYTGLSYGYWVPSEYADYHKLKDNWNCGVGQAGTNCSNNKKLGTAVSVKETLTETLKLLSYWVGAMIGTQMLIVAIPQIWTWGIMIPEIIIPALSGLALA